MKYKLLSVRKEVSEINIGDYVQALASSQFYPQIDGFVERDELRMYDEDECKIIMNGWYMAKPENWPPSDKIKPLFVAFHINSKVKDELLRPESIAYLKKHEPIGCRDIYTRDMLIAKGVDAYFSGCMTLTLGRNYRSREKENKVYFVDPYFVTKWTAWNVVKAFVFLICNFLPISKIASKYPGNKSFFRKCFILTGFYREYIKLFSRHILENAEYVCQQSKSYDEKFQDDMELLKEAERLIKQYSKASLVVTSRIHCALPCLSLETPVIYTEDFEQSEASACRFGGLRELFNVLLWKRGNLIPQFKMKRIETIEHLELKNTDKWKLLANSLSEKCIDFIKL